MNIIQIQCPSCNAPINADTTKPRFFCMYCGAQLAVDDPNYQTFRIIDEARIKEAEAKIQQSKDSNVVAAWLLKFGLIGVLLLLGWGFFLINGDKKQEQQLQNIAAEIESCIAMKDYDTALIKAYSIHADYNVNATKYWNDYKEAVINTIEQLKLKDGK